MEISCATILAPFVFFYFSIWVGDRVLQIRLPTTLNKLMQMSFNSASLRNTLNEKESHSDFFPQVLNLYLRQNSIYESRSHWAFPFPFCRCQRATVHDPNWFWNFYLGIRRNSGTFSKILDEVKKLFSFNRYCLDKYILRLNPNFYLLSSIVCYFFHLYYYRVHFCLLWHTDKNKGIRYFILHKEYLIF